MKIIDISMGIENAMPVYKNKQEKKPKISVIRDFNSGSIYESHIEMDMHTGTHIDMPLHVLPSGKNCSDLDISKLVTSCKVIDLTNVKDKITAKDLIEKDIKTGMFILLKTSSSYIDGFVDEFVYLDASGAEYLKNLGISGVGIDSLGIERAQPGHETHKILLSNEIIIIEGLRLAEVDEGTYTMAALPLKINSVEAVPARVILYNE